MFIGRVGKGAPLAPCPPIVRTAKTPLLRMTASFVALNGSPLQPSDCEHSFAFSRQHPPEFCRIIRPKK